MPKDVHRRICSTSYNPRSMSTSSGSITAGSRHERHLRKSELEDVLYPYTVEKDLLLSSYSSDSIVVLKYLPCADYDAVSKLLILSGFRSSVKVIRLCPAKRMALIEFSQRRMAESAVKTFNGMPIGSFILQAELRNGDFAGEPPKPEIDAVDLVKHTLYGSLNTAVYEDSSSEDEESRSSSPERPLAVQEYQSSIEILAALDDPSVVNSEMNSPLRFDLNLRSSRPKITSTTGGKVPFIRRHGPMPLAEDIQHPSTVVDIPTAAHSRARRLLVSKSVYVPLTTISMRADAQFINHTKRCRISAYSLPFEGSYRHVEDACIIGDTVVIGYRDSPSQISLIDHFEPERQPALKGINAKPHRQKGSHVGVSCLCGMPNARFLSGGYDHAINLWTTKRTSHGELTASVQHLSTLSATPNSLGYRECDGVLLAGFGQWVAAVNLERPTAKPQMAKLSNVIHQIHQHPSDPNLTIFEASGMETCRRFSHCVPIGEPSRRAS
ncbi:hypothetical protein PC9H_005168 [Pleurotus ostreatus]|uniref:RRM domain-containing protein n=1 Tax=Pleurotus ostreatus TaxID=5322 RepID=A0A8H7A083_PLEOS|nr:uncharacterized protein PC9H_005168 [Pleurotus ostreatus]KAF7433218.1 hypothetical protein PC9H_005168 [Pleurotus ostreatus]